MVCCDLIFYWFRFEYRAIKQHKDKLKKQKIETDEIEAGLDQIDSFDTKSHVKKYRISIENRLMCIWALIEIILLAIVLFLKPQEDYPKNFYKDVYDDSNYKGVINKMIAVRLLTGFIFFLGARMVRISFSNA